MSTTTPPAAPAAAPHRHGGSAVRAVASWPEPGDDGAPAMPAGFIASTFPALVATVADRCLRRGYGEPAEPAGERPTAVVLVSEYGDQGTAEAVAAAVDGGGRLQPLLFFQSVPNAVLGWVAARWDLVGPVVCVSPGADPAHQGRELADLLIEDGDADEVLLLLVEQAAGPGGRDRAEAHLICRLPAPPGRAVTDATERKP
ncbi:beta-ketoacyl synthase chain length factor [Kitasatospora sp. NPDC003701]